MALFYGFQWKSLNIRNYAIILRLKLYGVDESSLLSSRRGVLNEPRNVAVFLVRRLRGEKLEEIGRRFDIAKYSSVSSAIEKMKREMSVNRKLRLRVKDIEKTLFNSQQQP